MDYAKRINFILNRLIFLFVLFLLSLPVFPQEDELNSTGSFPPDSVRRPHREEAPRYPRDIVIGDLGRGTAPQAAWFYARDFLNALIRLNRTVPALSGIDNSLLNSLFGEIEILKPDRFRLGGGRIEADGTVSFLVRFLSQERSMTGELYLIQQDGPSAGENAADVSRPWRVDDFLLEESRDLTELREARRYDFTAYERLY